jgi:Ca-activated chloride channel family protein
MSTSRRRVVAWHALGAISLAASGWFTAQAVAADVTVALDAAGWVVGAPQYLWGLLLVPALLVLRAFSLSDLPRGQQVASFLLRAGVVVAIVASMIDVQGLESEPVRTATVFVVDVSESMPDEALERARQRVEAARSVRGRHEVRLVRFAGGADEVVLPTSPEVAIAPLERMTEEDGRATDLEAALRLAFGLLPHEDLKRLVVVTDGLETRGSSAAAIDTARRFNVQVHHLDVSDVPRPSELMVTGLKAPEDITPRVAFKAVATVKATDAMSAQCEFMVDGVLAETVDVDLAAGDNPVEVSVRVREGGDRRLAVACESVEGSQDRIGSNNRFEVPVRVPAKPKVLYVEGERRYRKNLMAALDGDFEVEMRGPGGVPATLRDAQRYDAIVISDVAKRGDLGGDQVARRHMLALERYVKAGGGLIWAGGENSFGPGGYGGTLLERKVLPVRFDVARKEDIPSLALMLVIDRSGSMSGPKLELAKEAARATLDVLQPSDKLGIIAFDSAPVTVVRLQRAANRLKITDSVSRLNPGGGTAIFPALDQAYRVLSATQAKVKHMILLTDGQSNRSGVLDIVAQAYSERITISTVAVGMGSDQQLLMQIAEEGGGRYYFTDRADNIPKLFLKEASEVSRQALVEDRFRARLVKRFRHHEIFKGLDFRKAPALLGYVSTRPKRRAEVMLRTHLGEPLLARWRLGLGRAVVWTSDTKNKWAHGWLRWSGYAKFWRQLVRDTLRVERPEPTFAMRADIAQGVLSVGVDAVDDDDQFIDGLVSEVTVIDPLGVDHPLPLRQTAPGHYEGRLALDTFGPYVIRGRHVASSDPEALTQGTEDGAAVHRSYQALAWPFPTEHLLGEPNLAAIQELSTRTGGVVAPTNAQLFDTQGQTTPVRSPRWPLPLYAALALLLLDVLSRRVRLYGGVVDRL